MKARYYVLCVILILAACTISQAATKVLEWKFDGNLNDTSGNGINGDPCGTISYDTGVSNQCFVADGHSSVYKLGVAEGILPVHKTDLWSVNVWVYPTIEPENWRLPWCLGAQPNGVAMRGTTRSVYSSSEQNITFTDGGDANSLYISTGVSLDVDQWQMITTTYDGRKVRIYKDGLLIGSRIYDTNFASAPNDVRVSAKHALASFDTYFTGKIDEFTVWNGVLAQQQILDLIPSGVIPEVNLVEEMAYYSMDDPCAENYTMPDHSGKFNTGLLNTTPVTIDGVKGQALKFDYYPATGQAIILPLSVGQEGQYSLAFWLKASWETYQGAFYCERKPTSEGGDGSMMIFRGDESGYVKLYSKDAAWNMEYSIGRYDATAYLNSAAWHHWAVTADGNEVRMYVDGEVKASVDYEDKNPKTSIPTYAYIGYSSESAGFLGWYNPAYMDEFHLYRGALTQGQVLALMSECNFDNDTEVYFNDFAVMADEWLNDTSTVAGSTYSVDDMEGNINGWKMHHNPKYSGTGTIALTTNAYAGAGALQWDYNLPLPMASGGNNYASIVYDLGQTTDFSSYDKMRLRLYKHSGNSEESLLYLKFCKYTADMNDANAIKAEAWLQSDTTSEPADEWELWDINLDSLLGPQGSGTKTSADLTDVRFILIGCGSWSVETPRDGRIDIDDMKMIKLPVCPSISTSDLNSDCRVDFMDFAIFADDWMLGVE